MQCVKCKKELPEGAVYCLYCGKKQVSAVKRKRHAKRPAGTGSIYKLSGKRSRPYQAVFPADIAYRLGDGQNVGLVEGALQGAAPVTGGSEGNPLAGIGGIGCQGVIGTDQCGNVFQCCRVGQLARQLMYGHERSSTSFADRQMNVIPLPSLCHGDAIPGAQGGRRLNFSSCIGSTVNFCKQVNSSSFLDLLFWNFTEQESGKKNNRGSDRLRKRTGPLKAAACLRATCPDFRVSPKVRKAPCGFLPNWPCQA